MSASRPRNPAGSSSVQHQGGKLSQPSPTSNPAWLEALLFNAKMITAGADALPFPYVKGVFGMVVFLLESVQKVKNNQESLKELCGDTVAIITVLRDQIASHGDTAVVHIKLKAQCEELERLLQDILEDINQLQMKDRGFRARIKNFIKANNTMDGISRFRTRIQELRSNFMLMAAMDTNFQVQKVVVAVSNVVVAQVSKTLNNCPPPSRIFHGRQTIIQQMHEYFTQNTGKQGIFVLHGLGGAGKTQIALKFTAESASRFTDMFFLDSSTSETIETGLKNIGKIKSIGDSSQETLQWLRSKQEEWLLLFDNADDPKINLNNYFPQCNHGNILITSRNPGLCVYASSHSSVGAMEETDAVDLLLRSAAKDTTESNKITSAQVVKALHYLPLAIIQAGAFISKSGNLHSYLTLYEENRARLLSQKPSQSHDNYAWTVYTTWQISFEKLSPPAAMFLQLCSLLHHQGISEEIFKNAAKYKFGPSSPSQEDLQMPLEFLSQFLGPTGDWDSFHFMDVTNEVRAYSLIDFNSERNLFSIHPLIHDWTRSTLPDVEAYHRCMVAITGMSLTGLSERDTQLATLWMLGHLDSLIQGKLNVIPDFRHEYGKIYTFGGKLGQAEDLHLAVLQHRNNILGEHHLHTLEAMYWLAVIYREQGNLKEAEQLEVVVVKQRQNILGNNHIDTLHAMANLAVTYQSQGKLKEAEELGIVLLKQLKNILGDNHPDTLSAMGNLACIWKEMGQLKEAEKMEVIVLDKRKHLLGDNNPETVTAMANLASTYKHLGRLRDAEVLEVVVLEESRNLLGNSHPHTLISMSNLGVTYNLLGQLQKAEEILLEALENYRTILGVDHPGTLRIMGHLAFTYNGLQRWHEAEELGVTALRKLMDVLGDNHRWTVETMRNLAITYDKLGKLKEAEDLNASLERIQVPGRV
ncbi:hypothetical protein C8R44DRAFT_350391 [Mycena epipterygia]|nr:hypothetical protein C8R44DRAFT_350391 [Mycena epipterygia]